MKREILCSATALVAVAGLAACGGSDKKRAGDVQAYCKLVAKIDAAGGPPTDAQLDDLLTTAPSQISDDVKLFVTRLRAADDPNSIFDDPQVAAAMKRGDSFKKKNC